MEEEGMKPIGGHLLPALAVIPALVVTGASLIALISGEAGNVTANAPPTVLSAGKETATIQPAPTQAPQGRISVEGQRPSVAAVQVPPERLPRQTLQPASTLIHHTALIPVIMRPPAVAQPQPSGNVSEAHTGSNSGSGSSNSGEDRGDDRDDDHEGDDDRGHGDDDRHDDDHGHGDHDHEDDD